MLFYITGISGSGKSTVLQELRKRGYEAYGTDEYGISNFYDRETGELLEKEKRPRTPEERTPKWRARYIWKIDVSKVEKLSKKAENSIIYLCGSSENEKEIFRFFKRVIALKIDQDTLMYRIASRAKNNFGKSQSEMASILEWHRSSNEAYKKYGHVVVDATQPLAGVVDEILKHSTEQLLHSSQNSGGSGIYATRFSMVWRAAKRILSQLIGRSSSCCSEGGSCISCSNARSK